jgi:hypothetical protein
MDEIKYAAFWDELDKIAASGTEVFKALKKATKPGELKGALGKGDVPESIRSGWLSSLSRKTQPVAAEAMRGEHRLLSTPALLGMK